MSHSDMTHASIDRARGASFLITQWSLLGISVLSVVALWGARIINHRVTMSAVCVIALATVLTAVAALLHARGRPIQGLITTTHYLDSATGLLFLYLMGALESPILGCLSLIVMKAPVYGRRSAQWGLAVFQVSLYLLLVSLWSSGGLSALPYGALLSTPGIAPSSALPLSAGAFVGITLCVAFLAGRASLDILTSQNQLQDAVARQTRELSQVNDAVSHDLRAPLQALISYSEFLEETPLNDEQHELLKELHSSAWRMAGMLESLNRLARLSGQLGPSESVPLDMAAAAALKNLSVTIAARGVQVEVARPLPRTTGDPALLAEVVQNLLENAIKYGDSERPRVLLEAAPASGPGRVAFAVEDNGLGISLEDRERIFAPFQRLERHREHEGVGTGLAVVERLVLAHGGHIRITQGELLGGARFIVELPAEKAAGEPRGPDTVRSG